MCDHHGTRPASVALLTTYYRPVIGGVETAAEHLARFLARRGHPVSVITKRTSKTHPTVEENEGVQITRTPPVGERRGSGKWLALPGFLAALWRLRRTAQLICCVDYRGIGLAALVAGALTGTPVVFETSTDGTISGEAVRRRISAVGLSPRGRVASALTWPIRAAYRHADLFVCVSHTIEQELLESGVPRDRITCLPHTVDRTVFRPVSPEQRQALRAARGLPCDAVTAVFVGRLSREKGIVELLHAWDGLRLPGSHLVVVGPDMVGHPWDRGPAIRELAARHGLSVTFTGGVAPDEVAGWLQAADVAVQPSHFEAFGIAAAEAMAVGLPVVATDVGGFRDYVLDGVNGRRVPPRDVPSLRAALGQLLTDHDLRRQLGRSALATSEQFDEEHVFTRLARHFDLLAAGRPPERG